MITYTEIIIGILMFLIGALLHLFTYILNVRLNKKKIGCFLKRKIGLSILGGLILVFSYICYGLSISLVYVFVVSLVLVNIAVIDIDTYEIPPVLNTVVFLIGMCGIPIFSDISITERVVGLFVVSGPMLVVLLFGGFGGGDVKLMSASGMLLGWKGNIFAFCAGVMAAFLFCIYSLISGKRSINENFAFGPFLIFGIFVAIFSSFTS